MKINIKGFDLFGTEDKQTECEKIVKLLENFDYVDIELEENSYVSTTLARLSYAVYDDKNYIWIHGKGVYPKVCKYQIIIDCKRTSYQDIDEDYKLIVRICKSQAYEKYLLENENEK